MRWKVPQYGPPLLFNLWRRTARSVWHETALVVEYGIVVLERAEELKGAQSPLAAAGQEDAFKLDKSMRRASIRIEELDSVL